MFRGCRTAVDIVYGYLTGSLYRDCTIYTGHIRQNDRIGLK